MNHSSLNIMVDDRIKDPGINMKRMEVKDKSKMMSNTEKKKECLT